MIRFGTTDSIDYTYDAAGVKVRKMVDDNGTITKRHYLNGLEYNESSSSVFTLALIHMDEGYIEYDNGNYVYNYTLKDHLGNTRVVVTDNSGPDVVQETDYYPFGMQFDNSYAGTEFDYKYNGKEYQDEIDLNLYDYGSRFYDPVLARWSVIDNKAEKYSFTSPYTYALNNPVIFIDPDGKEVKIYNMRPEQNTAMLMYMKTASGREYLTQFLKKNESVSFEGYTITGSANGKYSDSRLVFGAAKGVSFLGRSDAHHSDGTKLLKPNKPFENYIKEGDIGKLQKSQSFEMRVILNGDVERTADEWAQTLGHEVFGHSIDDAEAISKVIDALKTGKYSSLDDLGKILNDAGTSTERDHKALREGKNRNYNKYMKELEQNKNKDEEEK